MRPRDVHGPASEPWEWTLTLFQNRAMVITQVLDLPPELAHARSFRLYGFAEAFGYVSALRFVSSRKQTAARRRRGNKTLDHVV